jgi:hypothetical protein
MRLWKLEAVKKLEPLKPWNSLPRGTYHREYFEIGGERDIVSERH